MMTSRTNTRSTNLLEGIGRGLLLIGLLLSGMSYGHFISPTGRQDLVVDGSSYSSFFDVSVNPSSPFDTCTVDATVTVSDPTILAGGGHLVAKNPVFRLTALKAGQVTVTIQFSGLTNDDGFDCPANVTQTIQVYIASLKSTGSKPEAGSDGDPINTLTGELYGEEARPDLYIGGPMPVYFTRYYGSFLRQSSVLGDLGNNWLHNFDLQLQWSGDRALFTDHLGRVVEFEDGGSGWSQTVLPDVPFQLITGVGSNARLYDPRTDLIYHFDYTSGGLAVGKLVAIGDGKGNTLSVSYNPAGQLSQVTDGLGRQLTFTYNSDTTPKIASVSDGVRTVSYLYQDPVDDENLTKFTDARGNVTTFTYADTSGTNDHALMTQRLLPEGNTPYSQTFYPSSNQVVGGRVATQTTALGHTTTFTYDTVQGITTIQSPLSTQRKHTHDASGKLVAYQSEDNLSMAIGYDAQGRRSSVTDRLGDMVSTSFDAVSGKLASATSASGDEVTLVYVDRQADGFAYRDLSEIQYPDSSKDTFTYDSSGNQLSFTDRLGNQWQWIYNARGQITKATNPQGGFVDFGYDASANLTTVTAKGNTSTMSYDSLSRHTGTTFPDSSQTSFSYDANDNLLSITDAAGEVTQYGYDKNNRVTTVTNALSEITQISYDGMDRLVQVTDSSGKTTGRTFNELGLTATLFDAENNVTTFDYSPTRRLTSITDPNGLVWGFDYDAEGVRTGFTTGNGETWSFVSDTFGRATSFTDPNSTQTEFTYDDLGRLTRVTDPTNRITDFSFDAVDRLVGMTVGEVSAAYEFNDLGLLVRTTDAMGNDWTISRNSDGLPTAWVDPLGNQTAIAYDGRERISTVTFPDSLGNLTMGYDARGNVTQRTYSDGTSHAMSYDELGRLTGGSGVSFAFDSNGRMTGSNGITNGYDDSGRLTSVTLAPSKTVNYVYDAQGRLTQVSDWLGVALTLEYDDDNNLVAMRRSNDIDTVFTYDANSWLSGIEEDSIATITLTRDGAGRISTADRTLPLSPDASMLADEAAGYDQANRRLGYSHDALGRRLMDDSFSYQWNLANRLTNLDPSGSSNDVDFTYDSLGSRLSRSDDNGTDSYTWNYAYSLPSVATVARAGLVTHYYIHSPNGRLLYRVGGSSSQREFYHFDEMGNTSYVSNHLGGVLAAYAYSPYGATLGETAAIDNPFTWQGMYGVSREGNSPLYYLRARYYDSDDGCFLTRDEQAQTSPLALNPYQYGLSNPKMYGDATGLSARVNVTGDAHSDISVDVWEGDQLIGVLSVSFAAKGFQRGQGSSGSAGDIVGNLSTDGEFLVTYEPVGEREPGISRRPLSDRLSLVGRGRNGTFHSGAIYLDGSRAQDKQLMDAMLSTVGLTFEEVVTRTEEKNNFLIDGTGSWSTYRVLSQSCNDFTDAMLDKYFDENWVYQPLFTSEHLSAFLTVHLHKNPLTPDPGMLQFGAWQCTNRDEVDDKLSGQ